MAIASVQEKRAIMQERMAPVIRSISQAARAGADVLLMSERRTAVEHRHSTFWFLDDFACRRACAEIMVRVSYMIRRDYLILGAGIGAASACEGIRKYDKRGSVTLVGAEPFAPYKRWILSKSFLREKEANLKKLQEFDERWFEAHKIEARLGTVVTQFNIERRLAVLANGESIEFTKACLATGSRPVRPLVAGTSLGNVIYLRTIRDALALREMAILEKTIMVVGGGLLACESASSLRMM